MSASDAAPTQTDQSLFDSLCATLEAKLAAKICASLHKAVTRTVCATLKEGAHDVLTASDEPHESQSRSISARDAACIREFCPSLEDVVANAVCAALKQSVSDTVCSALKKAIHNTVQDLREAEKGAPLHVSPVEFCFSLEDVVSNAVCAALKQVAKDTICEPLKKAIMHSVHDALSLAQDGFPHDSLADVRLLYLGPDYVWHPPMHTDMSDAADACDRVAQTLTGEVCTRLQLVVAETLCPRLKKHVKRTIERHARELQAEQAVQPIRARGRVRVIASTHRTAFFAVTGIIIACLMSAMIIPGLLSSSSPSVTVPFAPPSAVPTATPHTNSNTPTSSSTPSVGPSESPTSSPTQQPTSSATLQPTSSPTPQPTTSATPMQGVPVYPVNGPSVTLIRSVEQASPVTPTPTQTDPDGYPV